MVTGHLGTHIALPLQEFAEKNGIVIFHNGPSSTLFTGEGCSPVGVQWGYGTYASANNNIASLLEEGGEKWFLITADFVYGHDLSSQIQAALRRHGGKVVGESMVPYPVDTVLPALQQARLSGADVVALSLGTEDMERAMREGYELGLAGDGIRMAAVEFFLNDIRRLGLYVTGGLRYSTSFYWDRTERTRVWAKDFMTRMGAMPTGLQAGVYSATRHYLMAVDALGSDKAMDVMAEMRRRPVNDGVFASNGRIRQDGRMMHDLLLVQVKTPSQSQRAWDYLDVLKVTPAEEAFRPVAEGGCRLVQ